MAMSENAILAQLWRKTIDERKLTNALPSLVKSAVVSSRPSKYRDVSAYARNIKSKEMSFKTFVSLLFDVLKVKHVVFKIELLHHNGEVSEHEIKILPDDEETENDDKGGK